MGVAESFKSDEQQGLSLFQRQPAKRAGKLLAGGA